ncbi:MAG TPA: asparagine synthase-related protein [Pyrinomonadaceae bacterium]|nr:asparagine synthase-related protein [Pyrinomonadaceae bacterium]
MSAIGGIVNFHGDLVDEELLSQLGQRLDKYGPDGGSEERRDAVGMVFRAFHTNLESRSEQQPLVHPNGCMLAWDGRLDNREELITLLRNEPRDGRGDGSIVMAAYQKWGITFVKRVIGDFALSLWDSASRTLLLARDPVGARLLFYHANSERVVWTSRLEALMQDVTLEIEDEYIAGYLTARPKQGFTPYKNIYAVPPAHFVMVRDGRTSLHRFWGLDPSKEIRYRSDREYEEHFLHLFSEAIRTRLRVDGPLWLDLSGGLDSSSIVCVADEVKKTQQVQCSGLETVSAVFDESSTSDERKFIDVVEEKRGKLGHHFEESQYPLLAESDVEDLRSIPNPVELWASYHRGVRREMRARRARVLLSGIGGDELLTSSSDPSAELSDLLVQRKLRKLNQRLQVWSLALKKPYVHVLFNDTVIPALPRRLRGLYKHRERAKHLSLLQPRFIKRFNLHDRLLGPKDVFGCPLPSSRSQSIAFLSVMDVISSGHLLEWDPIEISYPFTHRPLVEFLQAIPPTQWIRPGETRSLLRRALRAYLPPQIATRKGKGNPGEATLRAVAREWPRLRELLKDASVCAAGYVNPTALRSLIDPASFDCNPDGLSVVRICYLELWLRDFEKRSHVLLHPSTFASSPGRLRHAKGRVAQACS